MLKSLTLLVVGSIAAKLMKDYWEGARNQQQRLRQSAPSHAVQRWEDEGGLVPEAERSDEPAR